MPEMIDGVPACYGCIERMVIPFGAKCLQCDHLKGCEEYSEELRKSRNAFRCDIRLAERDNLRRAIQPEKKGGRRHE